jgi:hypothetical protein
MAVVIDSNLLIVLATNDRRKPIVEAQFDAWEGEDEELHAPSLIRYEIANALTRLLVGGVITEAQMRRGKRALRSPSSCTSSKTGPARSRSQSSFAVRVPMTLRTSRLPQDWRRMSGPSTGRSLATPLDPDCP